jgi:peptide/nickel transport system substrate-binding protein
MHLDPRVGTDASSGRVAELMLMGLITKTPAGELIPDLALSWDLLDGGRRYRFHLRPGVRFHDGRPLTAEDVAWTFNTMLDGTVASPKRGAFPQLERVTVVDPLTADFHLSSPYGALVVSLTASMGIVPAGTMPEEFQANPVGSGPFRLVERRPDRVVLEAFDGYYGGRPRLDRVIVREIADATVRALELRKGSVQLLVNALPPDLVPRFAADPHFRVARSPGAYYTYLGMNLTDPILADVRVRRALAMAIDRERLVETLWRGLGVPTETMLPPWHWARHHGLAPIPHDPAGARELLDRAGHPDPDGDGPLPRFTLVYKSTTDETYMLQAQIIQAMAAAAGIGIDIRTYEFATFYADIKAGSFQLFSLTWFGVLDPDLYSQIFHSARIPPHGANRGRYVNAEVDRLIEAGARLFDREERLPHYLKIQELLAEELPYISLFNKFNAAVMAAPLAGYQNYPSGELHSIKDMWWDRTIVVPSQAAPAANRGEDAARTAG